MSLNKTQKVQIVKKYGGSVKNTGLVEVQLALLSAQISQLTAHMIANKKDFASKRGLAKKVSRRKKLLAYLKGIDINRYRKIVQTLKLRGV